MRISKPRERRVARLDAERRGLIGQLRLDVTRAGVTKRVGQRLLNETIDGEARARAKLSDPRRRCQVERHVRLGPSPMLRERPQRRGQPELLERSGPQVGEDAAILALQGFHLIADRDRRFGAAHAMPKAIGQEGGVRPQMKEMRPEFVVQFVRDRLAFLVVSVEHPFDQLPIGGAKARERFGEAIDPSFSDLATFRAESFDAAISTMALMDGPDFPGAMREIARVLRPGGTLAYSILHPCFATKGMGWNQE